MNVNVSLRADDLTTPIEVAEARLATGETQVRLGASYSLYAYVTAEGARAVAQAWSDLAVRLAAGDGSGWAVQEDATHEGGAVDGVDTAGGVLQHAGSDDLNIGRSTLEAPPVGWSCREVNERGFTCTEREGHSGDHIALDNEDEFCDQWPRVESAVAS